MTERPPLSKAEMEILRVLWQLGRGAVRQVFEAMPENRGIDFATVQTYLRRLEAKGYVRGVNEGRTRLYAPKVRPRTVIRETLDDLIQRLFGGDMRPLMRHLIEDRGLSGEELAELRRMIDKLEKESGDDCGA